MKNLMQKTTKSQQQTVEFASQFASGLKDKDIILLVGDLGAGKTHFVKGLALGLGCNQDVTSPTFTLHNIYTGGRLTINHFDAYRLSGAEEAEAIGLAEYFDRHTLQGISVIEWPQNIDGLVQKPYYVVEIKKGKDAQTRYINIRREQ